MVLVSQACKSIYVKKYLRNSTINRSLDIKKSKQYIAESEKSRKKNSGDHFKGHENLLFCSCGYKTLYCL